MASTGMFPSTMGFGVLLAYSHPCVLGYSESWTSWSAARNATMATARAIRFSLIREDHALTIQRSNHQGSNDLLYRQFGTSQDLSG
jgi:hypothetical protein